MNAPPPPPPGGDDADIRRALAPPRAAGEIGRLGGYPVFAVVGRGGMGAVLRAYDPKLARLVAIKIMLPHLACHPDARPRFLREARATAAVKHENVIEIYAIDDEGDVPYIVMPFLPGETLSARLAGGHPLALSDVCRFGREVADGLAAAHAAGLIHRDVKPANVWLEAPRDRVRILDFGLARIAAAESSLTGIGAIIGTPAYMAPEQAAGKTVDVRADVFSLGVVLYQMATGTRPFTGESVHELLLNVVIETPVPVRDRNPGVPEDLAKLIHALLEKDPAARTTTAAAAAEILEELERKHPRQSALHRVLPAATIPQVVARGRVRAFVMHPRTVLVGAAVAGWLVFWLAGGTVTRTPAPDKPPEPTKTAPGWFKRMLGMK